MVIKALKYGLEGIYAVCALLLIFFALPQSGWKALDVLTGSMHPAIPRGSLVIIHRTDPAALKIGDIITYKSLQNNNVTITHRIVAKTTKNGAPYLITKGDANPGPDPEFVAGRVVGKVETHIPVLGNIVHFATRPLGLVILLGIPGLLIIISEFRLMTRRLHDLTINEERVRQAKLNEQQPPAPAPRQRPRPRPIIRAVVPLLMVLGLFSWLGVGATHAAWTDQAKLTTNTISFSGTGGGGSGNGGSGSSGCPAGTIMISNTGAGSVNIIMCKNTHTARITIITVTKVTNTNNQSANSGNTTATGNGSTGNVTSGSAGNSSSTSTTITNQTGPPSPSPTPSPSPSPSSPALPIH